MTQAVHPDQPRLLRSKFFWIALLYFSEGFPLGVFYELFPVWFRQQGVDLASIGALSLLGLAWTLKFLWAPAVDHYRNHRVWMATVDLAMGAVMLAFAVAAGFGPWVWIAIGLFTVLSATNDIAIDGYSIEFLDRDELGRANGIRIGFYRVGMLASGFILVASDWITWPGAFACAAVVLVACAAAVLTAPRERAVVSRTGSSLRDELRRIAREPRVVAAIVGLALFVASLVALELLRRNGAKQAVWLAGALSIALLFAVTILLRSAARRQADAGQAIAAGPMFGGLLELLERPGMIPVLAFILIFKLGDASMGFMVKPFWVDAGFTATEIGLVSANIGLVLSIAGGIAGGWYVDRVGIFRGLWVLALLQAFSNLGYAAAAWLIPHGAGMSPELWHRAVMYSASATESFTSGLGTAAFLSFLMAIVDKRRAATEYALLSSVFALSRSVAGWAGGLGAEAMGYAPYFLLTFFLSFPAYILLPWARRMLDGAARESGAAGAAPG